MYTVHGYDNTGEVASATIRVQVIGSDLTHIITRTARAAISDTATLNHAPPEQAATTTTYFNGFGEAVQTVAQRASPKRRDVITATTFDDFGRPRRQYLPYTAPFQGSGYGGYHAGFVNEQAAFYRATQDRVANDEAPYATTWYEPNGADGRPTTQAGPGADWQPNPANNADSGGHPVRLRYATNAANQVRRFAHSFGTHRVELAPDIYYPANTLALTETTDENGHPHRTFTDAEGREVLRQTPLDSLHQTWASTYTVYDDFGRKRLVLPPMAAQALDQVPKLTRALIDRWGYWYDYDDRGRLSRKVLPGPVPTAFVYNDRDQLILTGDTTGRWLFTKYDALGRPIYTGEYAAAHGQTRALLQQAADDHFIAGGGRWANSRPLYEVAIGRTSRPDTANVGTRTYSLDRAFPPDTLDANLRTRTFYDETAWAPLRRAGHQFAPEGVSAEVLDPADADHPSFQLSTADHSTWPLNLVTATQQRVLLNETDVDTTWLTTSTFYDGRLRPIQTLTDLADAAGQPAGQERTSQRLAWDGRPEQRLTRHVFTATTPATRWMRYERPLYYFDGRPLLTQHKLGPPDEFKNVPLIQLNRFEYNELGQLVDKRLHSADGGSHWAQSVDFRYHIRGWLTHLNDRHLLGGLRPVGAAPPPAGFDVPRDASAHDGPDLLGLEFTYGAGGLLAGPVGEATVRAPAQWTGNLTEQHWRTRTGCTDSRTRAYAYRYDAADRLVAAPFRTWLDAGTAGGGTLGRWTRTDSGEPLAAALPDYSLHRLTYDANGNLLTLRRWGAGPPPDSLQVGTGTLAPQLLDALTLSYAGNRLLAVEDAADAPGSPAPDFEDQGHHYVKGQPAEYGYDARGNLRADVARGLVLHYNALNLPARVDKSGGEHLQTVYGAGGAKLASRTQVAGHLRATVWAGSAVYEDAGEGAGLVAAWVGTGEGRLVADGVGEAGGEVRRWRYEYHLRDHLGNLRVAFQPVGRVGQEWASSFEEGGPDGRRAAAAGGAGTDSVAGVVVRGVAETRQRRPQRARTGEYVVVLGREGSGRRTALRTVGPVVRVALSAGDTLAADVWGSYQAPLRAARLGMGARVAGLLAAGQAPAPETAPAGASRWLPRLRLNVASVLLAPRVGPAAAPEAYLQVALYNQDSVLQAQERVYLSDSLSAEDWQQLAGKLGASTAGYGEVSLHVEGALLAYFDDLRVRVIERAIQENHYDPWGFNLVGIESEGNPTHRYQFNGKQKITDLDLQVNDHGARWLGLQVPPWFSLDPLAEIYPEESPYIFGHDNPMRFSDPDGRVAVDGSSGLSEDDTRRRGGGKPFNSEGRGPTTLVAAKATEQVVKQVGSGFLGSLGRFLGVLGLVLTPVQNGAGAKNAAFSTQSNLSEEEENAYNDLFVKKQNGTITDQGRRDLQELTDAKFRNNLLGGVITNETRIGLLGISDGMRVSESAALTLGIQFLGKGYSEDSNGSGRYVSADGTRVFRMGASDLRGHNGGDPHVNFETFVPNPAKSGKFRREYNIHVYFKR